MSSNEHEPMDRFPCARLTNAFYSIGSNWRRNPHPYDDAFANVVEKGSAFDTRNASKRSRCEVRPSTLEAWLLDIVRPLGTSHILGPVPMKIHALRIAPSCISLGEGRPNVSRIEFVVHRYGDAQGVHYTCLISPSVPYKLFAYKRIGTVPAGMLWSI
jgi:hypothetical protein